MNDGQNVETTEQTAPQNQNVADFNAHFEQLQETVNASTQKFDAFVEAGNREKVNQEVKDAAGKINETAGGDSDMAELFLEKQYRDNPDLKKIWDNRGENPEALNEALGTLAEEWAAKNKNLIDPQIAENQRALQESQNSGGTVQDEGMDAKLDKMGDGEFLSHMRQQRS
ncbi:MAG: hypothetical protein GY941_15835 [Planctomycetes bacterium]|nr:hypothetical protein [Planctomycetota bacterium]